MAAELEEVYTWEPTIIDLSDDLVEADVRIFVRDALGTLVVDGSTVVTQTDGKIDISGNEFVDLFNQFLDSSGGEYTHEARTPHIIRLGKYVGTLGFELEEFQVSISDSSEPIYYMTPDPNITLDEADVAIYTNLTINNGTSTFTIGENRTVVELFHAGFRNAVFNGLAGFITTIDSQTFNSSYNVVVNAGVLGNDLTNNRTLSLGSNTLTLNGTGDLNDITITGNVVLNYDLNLSNVTINGDLRIDTGLNNTTGNAGPLTFTDVTVNGNIINDNASFDLQISAAGSSNLPTSNPPGTGGNNVQILQTRTKTITGLPSGAEARIVRGSKTLTNGYEDNITDGDFVYNYSPDNLPATIRCTLSGFIIEDIQVNLDSNNQTIPATVRPDPSYV